MTWTGLPGLPGYSVFYSAQSVDATASIKAFFDAIKAQFPTPMTWSVPNTGDTIEDSTGGLVGTWTGTGGGTVAAGGLTTYAASVGAWVRWKTNSVVGRRRLQGRTFLAPLHANAYDSTGTIATSSLGVLDAAAIILAGLGQLVIWHRPTELEPASGVSALITSAQVPDIVTALRSRRY